jgi:hypothetical protein
LCDLDIQTVPVSTSSLFASQPEEVANLVKGKRWLPAMQHRMTIGTHWSQVPNWIDLVVHSQTRQRLHVMNVRKPRHYFPVHSHEIESAKKTHCPVVTDALVAGARITLVAVNQDSLDATFAVGSAAWDFFG